MACRDVSREMDGKTLFCRQWSATKAMKMKAELIKMGGEVILPFVEGEANIQAMMALEHRADSDELVRVIKEFVCTVRVDGEEITPATFDMKYKGELWFVVKLFAFACEVQYKDFFDQGLKELNDLNEQTSE